MSHCIMPSCIHTLNYSIMSLQMEFLNFALLVDGFQNFRFKEGLGMSVKVRKQIVGYSQHWLLLLVSAQTQQQPLGYYIHISQ